MALVSRTAFALLEAARTADEALSSRKSSSHTERQVDADLDAMVAILMRNGIPVEKPKRRLQGGPFIDPCRQGLLKKEDGWLRKFLQKGRDNSEENPDACGDARIVEDPDDLAFL